MKKVIVFIITTLAILSLFAVSVLADTSRIYDPDSLMTESEKASVESALSDAESKTGFKFRVYVTDTEVLIGESDRVREHFDLYSTDCVFLFVDRGYGGKFEYELFTYGEAYGDLSDSSANDILDAPAVYTNIKSGNLSLGLVSFANLTSAEILEARKGAFITVLIVSIVAALIAAGITVGIIIYRYKRKLKSPIYPLSKYATLTLDYSSDNFLGSSVTRTRVSSSRSGGRSGGGGGGSRGKR